MPTEKWQTGGRNSTFHKMKQLLHSTRIKVGPDTAMNSEDRPQPNKDYLVCSCKHCGNHIEFPAHGAGQKISCPHCRGETILQVGKPQPVVVARPPVIEN